MPPEKKHPKSPLEKALQRHSFVARALGSTAGEKRGLIAHLARTSPAYVDSVWRSIGSSSLRRPLIDAPAKTALVFRLTSPRAGKLADQIGKLGEQFVGRLFKNAKFVNLQGIDFELQTSRSPMFLEVKTTGARDSEAVLRLPVRHRLWTNTRCHRLIILTKQSIFYIGRKEINAFIKDFYFHHPKVSRKRDILVFIKPIELARLGYAWRLPIMPFARGDPERRKTLRQINAAYRELLTIK